MPAPGEIEIELPADPTQVEAADDGKGGGEKPNKSGRAVSDDDIASLTRELEAAKADAANGRTAAASATARAAEVEGGRGPCRREASAA